MDSADLLDSAAVGALLGVARGTVHRMNTATGRKLAPGFPIPVMHAGNSPLWLRADIEEWRVQRPRAGRRTQAGGSSSGGPGQSSGVT
jgi:predicted DNA-binding transcriptional regulator AlpA